MTYSFLPKGIRDKLPPLYSQEKVKDPIVHVKFFAPWTNWTWYATEFDGKDTFFGWVVGFEKELGYFSLSEMQRARGPMGLKIERDIYFVPKPLSEVMAIYGERMPSVTRYPAVVRKDRELPRKPICPACGGPLEYMGTLGRKEWYRCRNCGMESYRDASRKPTEYMPAVAPQTGAPRYLPVFKGYTVDRRLRQFRKAEPGKGLEFIDFDSPRGRKLLQEYVHASLESPIQMEGLGRAPQTEAICPACGGPGGSMGVLGRKEWFRCRNCGMEWSSDVTGRRAPQTGSAWAKPDRKLLDRLEEKRRSDPDGFYALVKQVRQEIKNRERGKIKMFPDIGLVDLRNILKQAERMYR